MGKVKQDKTYKSPFVLCSELCRLKPLCLALPWCKALPCSSAISVKLYLLSSTTEPILGQVQCRSPRLEAVSSGMQATLPNMQTESKVSLARSAGPKIWHCFMHAACACQGSRFGYRREKLMKQLAAFFTWAFKGWEVLFGPGWNGNSSMLLNLCFSMLDISVVGKPCNRLSSVPCGSTFSTHLLLLGAICKNTVDVSP